MTKIIIHGQKMQFHKKVAISVSLVQPTPYGTLTYTPAPGQPGLNSLPIGAQIVESSGDYLIKHNNVTIGEVEVSPASGYEFKNMVLWKDSGASITISTTPITLDDSDGITAIFIMSTISVTLTSGKGGTATFVPATGTSYTLSSLPVGTTIALIGKGSLELSKGNTTIGTIEYAPAPYYDVSSFSISRGGTSIQITSSPLELLEGDVINITFKETSIEISFYNSPAGQWYDFPSGGTMLTSVKLQQGYYIINGMYQKSGLWYLDVTDTSTETHFQWYFIPESGWSYTGLEINGKAPTFPYQFGTDDLTIVASTEQADALIIESNEESGRWVDSSGTYIASPKTIPYANININFEGKQQSPNSITSLRFSIRGDKDNEMFNYIYYYEYTDGYNIYLELDGNSMSTSETWGVGFHTGQHTLDARATTPLWKTYTLDSNQKTVIQNFIGSSDNCLGQRASSVSSYAYCFINNNDGILLGIDKYISKFMGFTIKNGGLRSYNCGQDSKLSNVDFNAVVNFERAGNTNNLEHALTNGGFSSLDDFCEYIMTTFKLS